MNKISSSSFEELSSDALKVRLKILELAYSSGGGQHLGGGLSMVEIMCYIYSKVIDIESVKSKSKKGIVLFFQKVMAF